MSAQNPPETDYHKRLFATIHFRSTTIEDIDRSKTFDTIQHAAITKLVTVFVNT